jgi:hypothetical protein
VLRAAVALGRGSADVAWHNIDGRSVRGHSRSDSCPCSAELHCWSDHDHGAKSTQICEAKCVVQRLSRWGGENIARKPIVRRRRLEAGLDA